MKFKCLLFVATLFSISSIHAQQPADLLQVYQDALYNDPTFQKAESDWLSARENLPIAISGYLPQINVQATLSRNWQQQSPAQILFANTNGFYTSNAFTLQASQAVYNYSTWHQIREAQATTKSALATYFSAAQDLMVRTANAYFAVLRAYDQLRFTISNKETLFERLQTAKEKFKVGLIAVTDVYEAESAYDQAVATQITDQNNLNNQIENLRVITGKHYYALMGIGYLPLVTPMPNDIDSWAQTAEEHNYRLLAQNYTVIAAAQEIKVQFGGGLPTLALAGQYQRTTWIGLPSLPFDVTNQNGYGGVTLNAPIFRGGLTLAKTRQARYNYLSASAQLEYVHRDVINQTRQNFLGVLTGISQIRADKATILSAKNALEATKAGYAVGTRTMVDVLNDVTALYQAEQRFAVDQYNYILSTVQLKQATSALSNTDFVKINCWLTKPIQFSVPQVGADPLHTLEKARTTIPSKATAHHLSQLPPTLPHVNDRVFDRETSSSIYYTIHLFASPKRSEAEAFISKQSATMQDDLHIEEINSYYKVIYGHYPSWKAAQTALAQLPHRAKQYTPWIARNK